jgi:putative transposase
MSYIQSYHHIVFSTKYRAPVLCADGRERFLRYATGILENNKSHLYRINCVDDHVHILTALHPTVTLAGLVKDLKISTNIWIKANQIFPSFRSWQVGYGAFTRSHEESYRVIEYIKGQEQHHARQSYIDELRALLAEAGLDWDERYLD